MILTEEQRGTVGFDLEKNRAAIDSAINSLLCEGWDNEASTVRGLVAEIERLRAGAIEGNQFVNELIANCNSLRERVWKAEARIKEQDDALVEERTGAIRCESYDHCEGMYRIDLPDAMIRAQQELQAEGKIGPDAAKPQSWQITEERKAALKRLYGLLVIRYKYSYPDETETLRAMLTEAE